MLTLFSIFSVYKQSTMNKAYKEGMEVNCKYVKRKQLTQYLSQETLDKYKSNFNPNNTSNNSSSQQTADTNSSGGVEMSGDGSALRGDKRKSLTGEENVAMCLPSHDTQQIPNNTANAKKFKTEVTCTCIGLLL